MGRPDYCLGVIIAVALSIAASASAFNTDTHQLLNLQAAKVSNLQKENYLKEQLGFGNGLAEVVNGRTVEGWIQRGGAAED